MDPHPWDQARQSAKDARREARAARREARRVQCAAENGIGGMMFGLIVIALGALFLLNNIGIIYIEDIWRYWPVIVIALGLPKVFAMRSAQSVTWGLMLCGIGALFLMQNLNIVQGSVWRYIWPVLIIGWGVSMLASHMDWWTNLDGPQQPGPGADAAGATQRTSSSSRVHIDVLFSGDERRIVAQDFEGGRCSAVFGGIGLDLRGAGTTLPEVRIHADAIFGGVDIRIPESWIAEVRGTGIFGGYVDKTVHVPPTNGSPAPRVIVKGGAVFGGVNVRN